MTDYCNAYFIPEHKYDFLKPVMIYNPIGNTICHLNNVEIVIFYHNHPRKTMMCPDNQSKTQTSNMAGM